MSTLIEAVANPGRFIEPSVECNWGAPLAIAVAITALVAIIWTSIPSARRDIRYDKSYLGILAVVAIVGGAVGGMIAVGVQGTDMAEQSVSARAAYSTAVGSWLASDYGIQTTDAEAESTALGNKLATLVGDEVIVVRIIDVAGGGIALVGADDTVVHPSR